MKLHRLDLGCRRLTDLSRLAGMQLFQLDLSGCTSVEDLSSIKGMPLEQLTIAGTAVTDLTPLADMKLKYLNCDFSQVVDLTPLKGVPLTMLRVPNTKVSNLAALEGMPLRHLNCDNSLVSDGSLILLKDCKSLTHLSLRKTKVTAAGAAALKLALPDCEIELE
jgi:Leucine-rich repeat (LRR) protein